MQTNTETITAARVRAEYDRGVQFNNGLGLYEDVKQCENFVEGRQWEGLKTKMLRPPAFQGSAVRAHCAQGNAQGAGR